MPFSQSIYNSEFFTFTFTLLPSARQFSSRGMSLECLRSVTCGLVASGMKLLHSVFEADRKLGYLLPDDKSEKSPFTIFLTLLQQRVWKKSLRVGRGSLIPCSAALTICCSVLQPEIYECFYKCLTRQKQLNRKHQKNSPYINQLWSNSTWFWNNIPLNRHLASDIFSVCHIVPITELVTFFSNIPFSSQERPLF